MPSPVSPDDFAAAIADPNDPLCDRFNSALTLGNTVHQLVKYMFTDAREFTDEFKADICALGCSGLGGGGGTGTFGLTAPSISASDGGYSDKVAITWGAVTGATYYEVYRNTVNNATTATLLGSPAGVSYDDTTAVEGTTYFYWVKARNSTEESNYSLPDTGYVGTPTTTLTAVADLGASQGHEYLAGGTIKLVWSTVTGAQTWDIYRNTVNDFPTATKIGDNLTPEDPTDKLAPTSSPVFVDNGGEFVYYDAAPATFIPYYYWVVARKEGPPAVSDESNVGSGWLVGDGSGIAPASVGQRSSNTEETTPGGVTTVRFALFGGGGDGAGGGSVYGGGGGGGGGVIYGSAAVVGGTAKLRVRSSPEADGANVAYQTNGAAGPITYLEYSAAGTWADTVALATITAPGGGQYSASGGGAGGATGAGSVDASVSGAVIRDGRAGEAGSTGTGGRSGYAFGTVRHSQAHFDVPLAYDGNGLAPGNTAASGSKAHPTVPTLMTGGAGVRGYAILAYY